MARERCSTAAAESPCDPRDARFAQFVMIWAMRNWARGPAGRVNVEREFGAALSPAAARIAAAATAEIVRLLSSESGRPVQLRPVPCRTIGDDEHRLVLLCQALLAGHGACARRAARELVRDGAVEPLVDHMHTLLVAVLEGNLPARVDRPTNSAALTLH